MSDLPDLADIVETRQRGTYLSDINMESLCWTSDDDALVGLHVHYAGWSGLDRAFYNVFTSGTPGGWDSKR